MTSQLLMWVTMRSTTCLYTARPCAHSLCQCDWRNELCAHVHVPAIDHSVCQLRALSSTSTLCHLCILAALYIQHNAWQYGPLCNQMQRVLACKDMHASGCITSTHMKVMIVEGVFLSSCMPECKLVCIRMLAWWGDVGPGPDTWPVGHFRPT